MSELVLRLLRPFRSICLPTSSAPHQNPAPGAERGSWPGFSRGRDLGLSANEINFSWLKLGQISRSESPGAQLTEH